MTATRTRRLVIVPLTALAVVLPALPAFSASQFDTSCGAAGIDESGDSPSNGNLVHTDPSTQVDVDPAGGRISGSSSVSWVPGLPNDEDYCDTEGSYTDTVAVSAGSTGLPDGSPVVLRATMRFRGTAAATGEPGSHAAYANIDTATFTVRDPSAVEGGDLFNVSAGVDTQDTAAGGSDYDSRDFSWTMSSSEDYRSGGQDDDVSGSISFDTGVQTMDFAAAVGDELAIQHRLGMFVSVHDGASSAVSDVDEFSVTLAPVTAGIVLGDEPAPEPEPEPEPSALEQVQAARAALASYGLHRGMANSLGKKLEHAERDIVANADACDDLSGFLGQVAAQRGKKVTTSQADALTAFATAASEQLGC